MLILCRCRRDGFEGFVVVGTFDLSIGFSYAQGSLKGGREGGDQLAFTTGRGCQLRRSRLRRVC